MKTRSTEGWMRLILAILVLGLPCEASARLTFNSIVVFGTSVSDPGNAYALLAHPLSGINYVAGATQHMPPYDTLDEDLTPSAQDAKGGHHMSNGPTWIEKFAEERGFGAGVGPAFQRSSPKARNYAVSGARAIPDYPGKVNLAQQVQAFLSDVRQTPPPNALYVIEFGNNDIRDAVVEFFTVYQSTEDRDQAELAASVVIARALDAIAGNIKTLYAHGARKFLVLHAARIDLVPAVTALMPQVAAVAFDLTKGFNQELAQGVLAQLGTLPGIQIAQLDVAAQMTTIVLAPDNFGLTNVTDPCITPNLPPFTCQQPDGYFFWDGIHPTKAVHAIIAQRVSEVLSGYPTPWPTSADPNRTARVTP